MGRKLDAGPCTGNRDGRATGPKRFQTKKACRCRAPPPSGPVVSRNGRRALRSPDVLPPPMDRFTGAVADLATSLRDLEARVARLNRSQWASGFPSHAFGAGLSRIEADVSRLLDHVEAAERAAQTSAAAGGVTPAPRAAPGAPC